jgi:hypothetical protein
MDEDKYVASNRARMNAEESALMASLKKLDARRATRRAAASPARDSVVRESKLLASIARLDDALKRQQSNEGFDASASVPGWEHGCVPRAPKPRSMRVRLAREYEQFCRRLLERDVSHDGCENECTLIGAPHAPNAPNAARAR